ncbi:MAG: hypothetical protein JXA18_09410, partial [Chitinispirillaceae bacterium]|nr:hypothetical protein [Chitinispirillaceae bacterium]
MSIHFVRIVFIVSVFLVTMVFPEHRKESDAIAGKVLIFSNDESQVLNKPNNFTCFTYYEMPRTFAILKWSPPLQGNNHLLGYICYFSKLSADIDT